MYAGLTIADKDALEEAKANGNIYVVFYADETRRFFKDAPYLGGTYVVFCMEIDLALAQIAEMEKNQTQEPQKKQTRSEGRSDQVSEYIERGALDDAINENRFATLVNGNVYTVVQIDAINNLPAADVEHVVRCKKCFLWDEKQYYHHVSNPTKYCLCAKWGVFTGEREFCNSGKERERC